MTKPKRGRPRTDNIRKASIVVTPEQHAWLVAQPGGISATVRDLIEWKRGRSRPRDIAHVEIDQDAGTLVVIYTDNERVVYRGKEMPTVQAIIRS